MALAEIMINPLTRDKNLLKRKEVTRGYWIRSIEIEKRLEEVISRFNLTNLISPLTCCMICNKILQIADKEVIKEKLDSKLLSQFDEFLICMD